MQKTSSQLIKIAKELAVIDDQDNNRINILCQPYSLFNSIRKDNSNKLIKFGVRK